jgi:ABC-type uncharacterized transport system permease subunit
MLEILIGAIAATGWILLSRFARRRKLKIAWWQWAITLVGLLYGVFVVEVIAAFAREGAGKAAVVMGTTLTFVAIAWAVLLWRFVFASAARRAEQESE